MLDLTVIFIVCVIFFSSQPTAVAKDGIDETQNQLYYQTHLEVELLIMVRKIGCFTCIILLMGSFSFSPLGHGDIPTFLEDVNEDGIINIQDLVLVAASFGQLKDRNAKRAPDVNRDGIVNVLDLVRVSNRFGQTVPDENSAYYDINVNIPEPLPPPTSVRETFNLDPFYEQWIDVEGLPVVASARVNPYAVKEAAWLIRQMVGHRQDILHALSKNGVRFAVMAYSELTTDIPEHSDLQPDYYWDRRARGLGSTPARPAVSCGEENLLNYLGDPYSTENILFHEFAHAIHQMGLNTVDPSFDDRLKTTFEAAVKNGLWENTYAITNKAEYWAEGTQSWFDTNRANDEQHNHVDTRDKLKAYDPTLAELLTEVFGDADWRYTRAITRTHLSHLQGFKPEMSPKFEWFPEMVELTESYQQLKDPDSDGDGRWINLKKHDLSSLPSLKSGDDDTETAILFVNNTKAEIAYYWVDYEGNEKSYGKIAPEAFVNQQTYVGHIWLIKDVDGQNLAVFRAEAETGRAFVSAEPLSGRDGGDE